MKTKIRCALLALAIVSCPILLSSSAGAATDFSISLGNAAFGYSDGYWDRGHRWHNWRNKAEAEYYRTHYGEHFYDARHDRDRKDRNMGWRNERWWEDRREERRDDRR